MSAPHADQLIEGYLARLRAAAEDLPAAARTELLDDMRAHIAEARAQASQETDATVLNILDRLGEPAVVVAEARERLGLRAPEAYHPGLLEIAALVLVPFLWPIGVILLWASPAWKVRDKLIGTLVPPGGYLGVMLLGLFAVAGHGSVCVVARNAAGTVIQNTCPPAGPPALQAVVQATLLVIIYVLPLITAGYLAIRLRWGRRPAMEVARVRT
ncbi:MAG TPA: hypothetical protein VET65_14500 [Candidatus Limnocylindrales bacterium]|nr:hypothetical protein [Candidatus Limnocylindrales bacterium]